MRFFLINPWNMLWLLPISFWEGCSCPLLWCTALVQKSLVLISDCTSPDSCCAKNCRVLPWDTFPGWSKRILQGWILISISMSEAFLRAHAQQHFVFPKCMSRLLYQIPSSSLYWNFQCSNTYPFIVSCVTNVFIIKAVTSSVKVYLACSVGCWKSWAHKSLTV